MDFKTLIDEIRKSEAKRIFIQLPEGLKKASIDLITQIQKIDAEAFLSAEPCYGACDLRTREAEMLGCDLIVHIGHSKFYKNIKSKIPVIYYPVKIDVDITNIDFSKIAEKAIGIVTTIQHIDMAEKIIETLKKSGKKPVYAGQILGCWSENAKKIEDDVEAFLFVGSGEFHPTGMKSKNIYVLDLEKKEIRKIDSIRLEKLRYANIFRARDAKTFGILVSTKPGQFDIKTAEKIKKKLENAGKKAFILVVDNINNASFEGIDVDAFVNTACPRIAEDIFSKPIINAVNIDEVFKNEN